MVFFTRRNDATVKLTLRACMHCEGRDFSTCYVPFLEDKLAEYEREREKKVVEHFSILMQRELEDFGKTIFLKEKFYSFNLSSSNICQRYNFPK